MICTVSSDVSEEEVESDWSPESAATGDDGRIAVVPDPAAISSNSRRFIATDLAQYDKRFVVDNLVVLTLP